jgi:3-oxoacyl-[acyl-carrier protein] reductase
MKFENKVAIVTGGGGGIGRGIALRLAQEGAKLVIPDLNETGADETVDAIRQLGGQALAIKTDVSDAESVQHAIALALETFGDLHILVNNAGTTRDGLILTMKDKDWLAVIAINLTSTYLCSKAAVKHMVRQRYGRIVSISSVVGLAGQAGQTNYAASKAGIIGFTKSLAKEVGSRGITVNAVAPGFIPTALTNVLSDDQRAATIKATPLGRLGKIEDVANAVAFLASDEASFITGHVLSVDGGLVMQ